MDKAIYRELLDMAAERGIPVVENEVLFKGVESRGIYISNEDMEVIFIKKSIDDQVEKNFILAHELGHCILEHKEDKSKSLEEIEEEANLYAYRLLGQLIEEIGQCCQEIAI